MKTTTSENHENIAALIGAKNNYVDKNTKIKEIDEKILDLLTDKTADFESELDKNLHRNNAYYETLASVEQFLERINVNRFSASVRSVPSTSGSVTLEDVTIKLPKLVIKEFDEDIMNWQTFWDQYYSSVHSKNNLSDIDKFTYLKSLLCDAISRLSLTNSNYAEAIDLLQKRYCNPQVLINVYMERFVQLDVITKSNDILYNQVETGICNLKTLHVNPDSYGSLLIPVLNSKLPSDLRTIFAQKFKEGIWDLSELIKLFRNELEAKERSFSVNSKDKQKFSSTSSALFNKTDQNMCVYCQNNHPSSKCRKVSNSKAQKDFLFKNMCCFICFATTHLSSNCTSNYPCRKCEGQHHISLCTKDSQNSRFGNVAGAAQSNVTQSTSANFNNNLNNVLLQTAQRNIF